MQILVLFALVIYNIDNHTNALQRQLQDQRVSTP